MIAAAAIVFNAELATANLEDFKPFVPHGLKLVEIP
jgi:predicted nucleic acid-binding protein